MKITHQIKAIFAGLLLSSSVVPVAIPPRVQMYLVLNLIYYFLSMAHWICWRLLR